MSEFKTGFPTIDAKGGLRKFGAIVAHSGAGKSCMAVWIASRLALQSHRVLFVAPEFRRNIMGFHFDKCLNGIDSNRFLQVYFALEQPWTDIQNNLPGEWRPDFVIVDSIDEMRCMDYKSSIHPRDALLQDISQWLEQTGASGLVTLCANRRITKVVNENELPETDYDLIRNKLSWIGALQVDDNDRKADTMRLSVIDHQCFGELICDSTYTVCLKTDFKNCTFSETTQAQYNDAIVNQEQASA